MREYKFRGKRIDNGEWVYGDLLQDCEICNVCEISDYTSIDGTRYEVEKETIGQYTGLHDKNGQEVYEGDIVKSYYYIKNEDGSEKEKYDIGEVEFYEMSSEYNFCKFDNLEVIGNIYENKELLEG